MGSIAREIIRGHRHLRRALDQPSFIWNGNTYPCTVSSASRGKNIESGGLRPEADLSLEVELSLFGAGDRPRAKEKLTHAGQTWRIEDASVFPGDSLLKLVCKDPAQRD